LSQYGPGNLNSGKILNASSTEAERGNRVLTGYAAYESINITLILNSNQFIASIVINNLDWSCCFGRIKSSYLGIFKNGVLISQDRVTSSIPIIAMVPTMIQTTIAKNDSNDFDVRNSIFSVINF
jgi:hypothetical protein